VSVYKRCASTANRQLKTIGDLFEVLAGETSSLPKDKLMPIRKRIASEVEKIAGNDENAVYSEGQRLALVSMFTHAASILETLK
jgi:UDP-2,3-diacylglucosamine pyrophosphatase LpxH